MEAIILAGGLGTRLRDEIFDLPKSMAPIGEKPFLEFLLRNLANKGFKHFIFSLGYKANIIKSYFGQQYRGIPITYVTEEKQLGTGGALKLAMDECNSKVFYVFNGDTYLDIEIDRLEKELKISKSPIIVGKQVKDSSRYGKLIVKNKIIKEIKEKCTKGPGIINVGCYILNDKIKKYMPKEEIFSLEKELLPRIIKNIDVRIFETKSLFIDIGIPKDYLVAKEKLIKK
tara:strand:+ start:8302 stop:8988 length:687 start_codon:yes stop_codon:yes gene_type:complete